MDSLTRVVRHQPRRIALMAALAVVAIALAGVSNPLTFGGAIVYGLALAATAALLLVFRTLVDPGERVSESRTAEDDEAA